MRAKRHADDMSAEDNFGVVLVQAQSPFLHVGHLRSLCSPIPDIGKYAMSRRTELVLTVKLTLSAICKRRKISSLN